MNYSALKGKTSEYSQLLHTTLKILRKRLDTKRVQTSLFHLHKVQQLELDIRTMLTFQNSLTDW